jgi:hypothetical protein
MSTLEILFQSLTIIVLCMIGYRLDKIIDKLK